MDNTCSDLIQQAQAAYEPTSVGPWSISYDCDGTGPHEIKDASGKTIIYADYDKNAQFVLKAHSLIPALATALGSVLSEKEAADGKLKAIEEKSHRLAAAKQEQAGVAVGFYASVWEQAEKRANTAEANVSRLINQVEEYKHKYNAEIIRADAAEQARDENAKTIACLKAEDAKNLMLERLRLEDGKIDMSVSGERAKLFMASLIEFFRQNGGPNFLTLSVNDGENNFAITIQNLKGEDSPAQKIKTLTDRAEKAESLMESMQARCANADACKCDGCLMDTCKFRNHQKVLPTQEGNL